VINENSFLNKIITRVKQRNDLLPETGLFHFNYQQNGETSRIHLRIDPDYSGLLLINANRIIHLNPTATLMAYLHLKNTEHVQAVNILTKAFDVPYKHANDDYTQFSVQIQELIKPDGACPIHDLEVDIIPPFSSKPSAPYRMDLAITYRCNNDCSHCYNARPRDYPELSTEKWYHILDQLWEIGIPHIVFTGGEPTLREDLPDLIAHAEHNGQITGINTNGRRLSDSNFIDRLVKAGLDHVQITLESHDPLIHDGMVNTRGAWKQTVTGIRNVLETSLYVMTNTTMLHNNSPVLAQTLEFLADTGVPTVGLNALIYSGRGLSVNTGLAESELHSLLNLAQEITSKHGQRLIWYTPTQYCNFDPMQLELGVKGCTAALYNMCIEPNGDVIPCQSYYSALGNFLTTPWNSIWNHELSINLRERKRIPEKCLSCSLVTECGGGCPLVVNTSDIH
jgi:radical SAM protein with 4Fe4S-binding SPASM domain